MGTDLSFSRIVESSICHEEDNSSETTVIASSTAVPPANDILTRHNLDAQKSLKIKLKVMLVSYIAIQWMRRTLLAWLGPPQPASHLSSRQILKLLSDYFVL